MAETQTPNFKWTKPDLGGDSTVWGNVLNATLDAVDSVAWSNQQAGVPIGSIQMFGGSVLPPNWLWCNGAVYLDTDIPALAPILARKYTGSDSAHNAVPNLNGRSPVGADFSGWSMGLQGGEYNHTLLWNEMPVHSHTGSQAAHTHSAYQDVHVHAAWQDVHAHTVANGTHNHNIVTGNHGHGVHTGAHNHTINNHINTGQTGMTPGGAAWGLDTGTTSTVGDLGGSVDVAGNLGGYTDQQYANIGNTDNRQPGTYTDNRQPGVHVDTQQPGVSIGNAGGGAGANVMSPYTVVAFIIRYK